MVVLEHHVGWELVVDDGVVEVLFASDAMDVAAGVSLLEVESLLLLHLQLLLDHVELLLLLKLLRRQSMGPVWIGQWTKVVRSVVAWSNVSDVKVHRVPASIPHSLHAHVLLALSHFWLCHLFVTLHPCLLVSCERRLQLVLALAAFSSHG